MHGVKREKQNHSADVRAARKAKEAAKLQAYLEVENRFFQSKKSHQLSSQALDQTAHLLGLNPELYTCWNYRRQILLHLFQNPPRPSEKVDFFASARTNPTSEPSSSTSSSTSNASDSQPSSSHETRTSGREDESPDGIGNGSESKSESISEERKISYKSQLLANDLEITMHALRAHPKVYWIWNHRKWCLEQLPEADSSEGNLSPNETGSKWKREIKVVEKMLDLDPRNFHGWDYRRYLLSRIAPSSSSTTPSSSSQESTQSSSTFPSSLSQPSPSPQHISLAEKELDYTLKKIQANFSNFSAWHQRSKILPRLWDAKGWDEEKKREARSEELELVKQAMYTDPTDQSVWLYHRWIVEQDPQPQVLKPEIEAIKDLLEEEEDSKWCMQSLSHYLILLSKCEGEENREDLISEATSLLERLVEVDSDRKERYRDILRSLKGT